MIEVATIEVLAVPPNLLSFIRAQTAFASSHLPLVVTFALAVLIIPGWVGIRLHRAVRRRFPGRLVAGRAMGAVFAIGSIVVVNDVWPELYLILPAAVGLFAGWTVRPRAHGAGHSPAKVLSLVAGILGALLGALLLWVARIALWDGLVMLVAAGLGYLGGCSMDRRGPEWEAVALAVAATVGCLAVAEIAVRLMLPPLPMYYPDRSIGIRFPPFDRHRGEAVRQTPFDIDVDLSTCTWLYGDGVGDLPKETSTPAVLHVGDSMTEGADVDADDRFVGRLQREMPEVRHINLGLAGTAPDFYLLVARKWVRRMPVALVVVHLFVGNDIEGLGQPQRCCEDGPLLRLTTEGIDERCPTPTWSPGFGESLAWFASASPPPAIVRHFAPISQFARYLVAVTMGVRGRWFAAPDHDGAVRTGNFLESRERSSSPPPAGIEQQWTSFEAVMRALRDEMTRQHVPLVVSVLPLSVALEKPEPKATESYRTRGRILEILHGLDIDAVDPWEELESVVKRDGPAAVFLPEGDVHFGANGHRLYAAWLLPRLRSRLAALSAKPAGPRPAPE